MNPSIKSFTLTTRADLLDKLIQTLNKTISVKSLSYTVQDQSNGSYVYVRVQMFSHMHLDSFTRLISDLNTQGF